jgi:hypothetical protein
MCTIPIMRAPYFIEEDPPKLMLDTIEMIVVARSLAEHQPAFQFIQEWGRYACVAAG